jgi:hypothetical protein
MSSVKVVDLNEEVKEEAPVPEAIEEAPEEEQPLEIANDVVEENANEEPTPKPEPKAKARPKQLSQSESSYGHRPKPNDLVLRYSHKCSTEPPPVKKQANPKPTAKQTAKPKPKQVPKPPPDVYYSDSDDYDSEDNAPQQPLVKKKQTIQPSNPLLDITNNYALLQQQLIQQKQQRYKKVCASIFAPRSKKR